MALGKEVKVTSFADDATYFLSNLASVYQLFRGFEEFQSFSSLKVSREKYEISGLGLSKGELGALSGCKPVNLLTDLIYILVIYHSYNQKLVDNRNLLSLIEWLQNVISLWKSRGLTLAGKIKIFKTFGILNFCIDNPYIKHSTLIGEYEWRTQKC